MANLIFLNNTYIFDNTIHLFEVGIYKYSALCTFHHYGKVGRR